MKRLVRLPGSPARSSADVDAELAFHLDGRIEELMARGMTRDDAEREAMRRFGDPATVRAEMERIDTDTRRRTAFRERVMELARDARFALRTLGRRPLYTGAILVTIALGVGANAAVFSAVHAVLRKPFEIPGIGRLAVVRDDFPRMGLRDAALSPLEALDLFDRKELFTTATAVGGEGATIEIDGVPTRASGAPTIGDFFGTFAVRPALGRTYRPEDSEMGRPRVVVLSHRLWTQLSADSAILGTTLRIGETPYEVIGVLPASFGYPRSALYWRPMTLDSTLLNQDKSRGTLITGFVGRMRDGLTVERLGGELRAIAEQWHRQYAAGYANVSDHTMMARSFVIAQAGELRPIVTALLVAVTLVLLLACANVASLQLVRAAGRARELAVRAALGAGRGAIARTLLVESTLLTVGGALLGLVAAQGAVRWVRALELSRYPVLNSLDLSAPVLAYTGGIAVLTGILVGVAPGLRAMRTDVSAALRDSGRGASGGASRHRLLRLSVVSQHALTLLLLVGAGLTMRSLDRLLRVDPGFAADDVVAFSVSLPQQSYTEGGQRLAFWRSFEERLRAIPGVQSVGFALGAPFTGSAGSTMYDLPGVPPMAGEPRRHANQAFVFGDYFRTMGIEIVRGRAITMADGAAGATVVVVDETLVRQSFGRADPIGASIVHGAEGTIVGVARSVKLADLTEGSHPLVYHNYGGVAGWVGSLTAVVRTSLPPAFLLKAAQRSLAELDPSIPIADGASLRERLDASLGPRRLSTRILGAFAGMSLVLALLGVYAVMSHVVSERSREIGIRTALGAQRSQIMAMVMREGMTMAVVGLAIGAGLFAALGRLMRALVYGVPVFDAATLVGASLLLVGAALGACWLPSRRAVRVDPAVTLKAD
ncbi:MAG: ABC transporter permease [Gemmatimonadetes bacterium]|nr:ABC transporter permease [Gemmatimonadota bacterium]